MALRKRVQKGGFPQKRGVPTMEETMDVTLWVFYKLEIDSLERVTLRVC